VSDQSAWRSEATIWQYCFDYHTQIGIISAKPDLGWLEAGIPWPPSPNEEVLGLTNTSTARIFVDPEPLRRTLKLNNHRSALDECLMRSTSTIQLECATCRIYLTHADTSPRKATPKWTLRKVGRRAASQAAASRLPLHDYMRKSKVGQKDL
jgi:hypothetical protein